MLDTSTDRALCPIHFVFICLQMRTNKAGLPYIVGAMLTVVHIKLPQETTKNFEQWWTCENNENDFR